MRLLSALFVLTYSLTSVARDYSSATLQTYSDFDLSAEQKYLASQCHGGKFQFYVKYGAHLIPVVGLIYDAATGQLKKNGKVVAEDVAISAVGTISESILGTVGFGILYLGTKALALVGNGIGELTGSSSGESAHTAGNDFRDAAKDSAVLIYTEQKRAKYNGIESQEICNNLAAVNAEVARRKGQINVKIPAPTGLRVMVEEVISQESPAADYSGQD